MTTQTEALKLALEALDQLTNAADTFSVSGVYFNEEVWAKKCLSDAYFAITAIEQALAQPEQGPDYAWPTIEDYENEVGFSVGDAFKMGWSMARTTNDLFVQMVEQS